MDLINNLGMIPASSDEQLKALSEKLIRQTLLSDNFLDFMQENMLPMKTLMSYYECALMEIETKFRVLNTEFSLEYDRNPIENIKTRIKSMDSLARKIRKKIYH